MARLNCISQKETQALCSGLDSNCVHQSFLSLAHIHKSNPQDLLAHRNVSHLLFTGLHNPDGSGKNVPNGRIAETVGTLLWDWADRASEALPCPEEQRYHRLNWPGACCDCSGHRTKKKKEKKEDRADCNVNFCDGVQKTFDRDSDLRRSLDFSTELNATWLCLDGSGAKHEEDILSFKQKNCQLLLNLTNGGQKKKSSYSTVPYKLKRTVILSWLTLFYCLHSCFLSV